MTESAALAGGLASDGTPEQLAKVQENLGLAYGTVKLLEHDVAWAGRFHELADQLWSWLARVVIVIEHVGSTAVPGLPAKPIIDIAAARLPRVTAAEVQMAMAGSGWEFRGDKGADGGLLFVLEVAPAVRIAHLHVVSGNGQAWRDYLAFRDLLRADVAARQRYGDMKQQLAVDHPSDRGAYTMGKEALVRQLLRRAGGGLL